MTIEYTYPERPSTATVRGLRKYTLEVVTDGRELRMAGQHFSAADVPEVCEAMMRLAGHGPISWDTSVKEMGAREAGERIIARLSVQSGAISGPWIKQAIAAVREECGLQ